jgi:large subunit ribosomal protein L28
MGTLWGLSIALAPAVVGRLASLIGRAARGRHPVRPISRRVSVASVCDVCGKGPGFGKSVSHSHRRTSRRWNPNIQRKRVRAGGGTTRRVNVCTSCLKAGKA